IALGAAFIVGTLFHTEDDAPPPIVVSPYHVEGTKTNGSGFVNECSEPSPCAGKDPVGRLREGDPVYIECQTTGDLVRSIATDHSRIWDRLDSGVFVSDLFVSTPGEGRFSSGIPRCSSWD